MIAWGVAPLSQFLAGPLADRVLEPFFRSGAADGLLTRIFGSGAGAGMGFQLALAGLLAALVGVSGYLFPAVRDAEDQLPDHDATEEAPQDDEETGETEPAFVPT
jgi:hypothetical protein